MRSEDVPNDNRDMRVTTLIDKFLAFIRVQVVTGETEPATELFYTFQLAKLRKLAGDRDARQLEAGDLLGLDWTNHIVRAMKRLYRWAEEERLVERNPFKKIKTPPTGQRERVLSAREVVLLYRHASRKFARFLFAQLHTIARPGELRTLTWSMVDLDARVLRLSRFKGKKRRRDKLGVRLIPLDAPLTAWLIRERFRRRPAPGDFVFSSPKGKCWTTNSLRCAMRAARRRAGLSEDHAGESVVCYTMRHTGATEAVRNGIVDTELADIMGHTSIGMTRRYLHRTAADLVGIVDRRKKK